ncbi:multicopper oxidase family protein [Streptomyces chiangmaiensis]|uniref:Multicopper oxidase family protein n=1 Tax=Streptomyces chiangmaiensis TaxID=766497 RepID=A0ABU7FTS1_9ACTN|nr:multicopper oxidase family protein [Streptomyces chiangmaiensis]MED7827326.1 multicopper oxidase family protein [Streptomyces chiangmaiensis]
MTTAQWIVLDHAIALLGVVSWFGAGVAAALRRHQLGFGLLIAAVLVTLTRAATVSILAGRGWWFVADKVLLGLPLLGVAGVAAVLTAGPRLWTAIKAAGERPPASCVVSLFTAAYAALAGLVVTFLGGYPLTWSTALTTVSLVSAGAVLTARVVAREADDEGVRGETARHPAFTRRRFINTAVGAGVVGAGGAGVGLLFRSTDSVVTGGGPGHSSSSRPALSVADLRGLGSPSPGGARHRHVLTAKAATVRLGSGREIDAWTYNGHVPGPAITATEGDVIEVTLRNSDIEDGVTQHWHGYDVPCGEDGVPDLTQRPVAPGEEFVYRFRADQVGTYWYHTHEASDPGVRKGLYGTLVVTPRAGQRTDARSGRQQVDLTLPVHTFAGIVVVGDQDGRTEQTAAPGTAVRLRLINTDSDPHRLTLAGTPFRVAAVDGRDLNHPEQVRDVSLRLPAGGRYDLVFVMPDTAVALVLDNHRDTGVTLHPDDDAEREPRIEDTSDWPELDLLRYGTPARAPFDPDAADRHFTLVLDRALAMVDGRPAYAQTVNGRGHPSVPDLLVAEGDVVRLTVVNRSLETHPWHLHGHSVLILSRDGTPSSGSPLWMDTFEVRAGEVWEVAFKATNPGIWMNHCHNLRHAEQGMMLRVAYDGVTTHFGYAHATHG